MLIKREKSTVSAHHHTALVSTDSDDQGLSLALLTVTVLRTPTGLYSTPCCMVVGWRTEGMSSPPSQPRRCQTAADGMKKGTFDAR